MGKKLETALGSFDGTEKNVLRQKIHGIDPTIEQVTDFYEAMLEVLDSMEGPFVVLVDASESKWVNTKARIEIGQRQKEIERKYADVERKIFFVMPNVITKMMLQGVNLVSKPIIPQAIYSNLDAAIKDVEAEIAAWWKSSYG